MREYLARFFTALGYFARLPVPAWVAWSPERLARAAAWLPLVGWVVGLAGATALYALARGGRPQSGADVLAEYGGFEIAMMAGAMLGAAEKHMLILVDGFIVNAAVLVAHAINHNVLAYCVFAHRSQEPGHRVQLDHLDVQPLMELDLRLGEGTGAALALPLVQAAVNFLNEMASFESAGVSDQESAQ